MLSLTCKVCSIEWLSGPIDGLSKTREWRCPICQGTGPVPWWTEVRRLWHPQATMVVRRLCYEGAWSLIISNGDPEMMMVRQQKARLLYSRSLLVSARAVQPRADCEITIPDGPKLLPLRTANRVCPNALLTASFDLSECGDAPSVS